MQSRFGEIPSIYAPYCLQNRTCGISNSLKLYYCYPYTSSEQSKKGTWILFQQEPKSSCNLFLSFALEFSKLSLCEFFTYTKMTVHGQKWEQVFSITITIPYLFHSFQLNSSHMFCSLNGAKKGFGLWNLVCWQFLIPRGEQKKLAQNNFLLWGICLFHAPKNFSVTAIRLRHSRTFFCLRRNYRRNFYYSDDQGWPVLKQCFKTRQ